MLPLRRRLSHLFLYLNLGTPFLFLCGGEGRRVRILYLFARELGSNPTLERSRINCPYKLSVNIGALSASGSLLLSLLLFDISHLITKVCNLAVVFVENKSKPFDLL